MVTSPKRHRENLARVFEATKYPTRNTSSLQLRVSVTVLYYKFCFAYYKLISVVDELCTCPLNYTNVCACFFYLILLIIEVDEGKDQVLDSLLKDVNDYAIVRGVVDK